MTGVNFRALCGGGSGIAAARAVPGDDYAMSVDKSTVVRIAELALIRVSEDELDKLALELDKILHWIEQLDEIDTEGVAPMTSVAEMTLRRRDDEVTDGGYRDKIVANAPAERDGFFVVPKVIE